MTFTLSIKILDFSQSLKTQIDFLNLNMKNQIIIFINCTNKKYLNDDNKKIFEKTKIGDEIKIKYYLHHHAKTYKNLYENDMTYHIFEMGTLNKELNSYIGTTKMIKKLHEEEREASIKKQKQLKNGDVIEFTIKCDKNYGKLIEKESEYLPLNKKGNIDVINRQGCFKYLKLYPISNRQAGVVLCEKKEVKKIIEEITDEDIPTDEEDYYSDDFEEYKDELECNEEIHYDNFDDIIDNNSKFICMVKPTQSRKTYTTIQYTKDKIRNDKKIIQIVDNSLLQNQQFVSRMKTEMISQKLIEFSGRKNTLTGEDFEKFIDDLCKKSSFFKKETNTIVACKNYKQLDNIYTIIRMLEYMGKNIKFVINVDEIDNTLSIFDRKLEINKEVNEVLQLNENINFWKLCKQTSIIETVLCITGTPLKLFKYFQDNNEKLQIFNLSATYDEKYYYGFKDSNFTYINQKNKKQLVKYVKYILENKLKTENSYLFIPGKTFKREHIKLKDLLISKYNVLIINSDGKKLYTKDRKEIKLDLLTDKEFSEQLPEIIKEYKLDNLAITGNISVGRGVTFVSKDFIFTDAIFSDFHLKNNCNAYQIVGRITGNFYYLYPNGFNKINVYCSTTFAKTMKTIERISMEYAVKYNFEEYNHEDIYTDEKKLNNIKHERDLYENDEKEFKGNNPEQIMKYIKEYTKNKNYNIRYKRKFNTDELGFIKQSFENKKKGDEKVYSKEEFNIILKDKSYTSFLSKLDKDGYKKRIFWYYENKNDINSLCAYLKVLKIKSEVKIEKI